LGCSTSKLLGGLVGVIVMGTLALMMMVMLLSGALALLSDRESGTSCSTSRAASTGCIPPSGSATAVVQLALEMASHLYINPACQGVASYPNCYDTWYDTGFPQAVLAFGQRFWPGRSAWHNGTFQCVSYVLGAYSQVNPCQRAGTPLTSGDCIATGQDGSRYQRTMVCPPLAISSYGSMRQMAMWPLSRRWCRRREARME